MRIPTLTDDLRAFARERADRLGVAAPDDALLATLAASDFAADVLRHEPDLLARGLHAFVAEPVGQSIGPLEADWPLPVEADAMRALRRARRRESLRIVMRDVLGIDDVGATLAATSMLADRLLELALRQAESALTPRFGTPRHADGTPMRLAVIAMGKLGGGELNFSSDVDLVFAFAEAGASDGARSLDHEDWFLRLGQRFIQLLAEVTADGFAYRVDMRLRPFGGAGRLALSFAAMEHYYQRDGRDWERYAWIKARTVAGDRAGGARLIAQLAPFVYRRYLDFTAIDGLREMKALIDAEVDRRELADNLKLGPGGIREVEFLVQLLQLVRGGRDATLRTPSFRAALAAARASGHLDDAQGARLGDAYDALRRIENRVQMLGDQQTHDLPADAFARRRIAVTLGFADETALAAHLAAHRAVIAAAFADVLRAQPSTAAHDDADWKRAWLAITGDDDARLPPPFGAAASDALHAFARTTAFRMLDARTRARLDALMPRFLARLAANESPDEPLLRLVALVAAVLGRPTYLALLDEQPAARERLAEVVQRSAFLAERVAAHPLLLDDLLDERGQGGLPDRASVAAAIARSSQALDPDDVEEHLVRIAEARQSAMFRLALAWLSRQCAADLLARHLAGVAEAALAAVLSLAWRDTARQWGRLPGVDADGGIAVIGYGSLGGAELGFGSDLDLVFVTDAALAGATSEGARAVDASRWFARVAQRLVHWLTTPLPGGAMYAVDTRLRPDGSKGLLVTTLDAFAGYQVDRAWVWEHQALVRARAIAGDARLVAAAADVRATVLRQPRDAAALRTSVIEMRERWRAQLDRSDAAAFDLKQGRGGLVDLEFALQFVVLREASRSPALTASARTRDLIALARDDGLIEATRADALVTAHDVLLAASLDATLNRAPRVVRPDAALDAARAAIVAFTDALGLAPPPV